MTQVIRSDADEQQQKGHKEQRTSRINTSNYFGTLIFLTHKMIQLCDANYTTFRKRRNFEDSKNDKWFSWLRMKRGMNKQSTEDFQGSEKIL